MDRAVYFATPHLTEGELKELILLLSIDYHKGQKHHMGKRSHERLLEKLEQNLKMFHSHKRRNE